jgi:predicted O-methyltransferase YrrM
MKFNVHQIKNYILHFFKAKRNGHGIHSPFAYKLCEEIFYNDNIFYAFKGLNQIRKQLLLSEQVLEIVDMGAGSKTFKSNRRKIKDIAEKGISAKEQSELLYKLLNLLNCNTIIELGTSIGLNTLYLAAVNHHSKVITIEGSPQLNEFAKNLADKCGVKNIQFICADFDSALPEVLNKIEKLDCLYVDGNHTYSATVNYFEQALKKRHNNSVFVFDDIYWSPGMTKAWDEIKKHSSVTLSIDAFYFGIVFFNEDIKEKTEIRLFI